MLSRARTDKRREELETELAVPPFPLALIGVLAAGATVMLKDPIMRFMIVPGSWDDKEVPNAAPITFEVMEALR